MVPNLAKALNPEKALIFRITHLHNLPWLLENGLHCGSSSQLDPAFVTIGSRELISRRRRREVPLPPGGTLSDYVPFYFTPFSPMLYNIQTGYGGIPQVAGDDLVILISSLHRVSADGHPFLFTDRHV